MQEKTTMRMLKHTLAFACTVASGLAAAGSAYADTLINNFDNINFSGTCCAWSDPNSTTITQHATNLEVDSVGFGLGFGDVAGSPANASGNNFVRFDVTVDVGNPAILAVLDDGTNQYVYRFQGVPTGNHIMYAPINPVPSGGNHVDPNSGITYDTFRGGAMGTLDLSSLKFYQIQGDGGSEYDIHLNDLSLTKGVPEPASIAMLVSGAIGMAWVFVRRRGR
jgi:hypothetical protein